MKNALLIVAFLGTPAWATANVVPLTVGCNYVNELCVSVQVCKAGENNCTVIDNILLDTGSSGLRIFNTADVRALGLTKVSAPDGGTLAECNSYIDDSSDWGPIVEADVVLGGLTASDIRVQLIEAGFAGGPKQNGLGKSCPAPDRKADDYNGILGIAPAVADCGSSCAKHGRNETYYSCSGGTCKGARVAESDQVSNPIAFLSEDNNGYAIKLSSVSAGGEASGTGSLILGVGTHSNNSESGLTVFKLDAEGNFSTTFNGKDYDDSFVDSGTSTLQFPKPTSLPVCADSDPDAGGYFCPAKTAELEATQFDSEGTSMTVSFKIMDAHQALSVDKGNMAYDDIGIPDSSGFNWGLPFFFGRKIYFGIEGKSSPLGDGTYVAY